jgi:hypothetical protein
MTSRRRQRDDGASSTSARALKWVGAATAIISLILGARQIYSIASDRIQRGRQSTELVALARQQADRGAYADAWTSLDQAEQQSRTDATVNARLDVAFRWLEDGRPGPNQPFSCITDAVVPTLDRALLDPDNPRRADILAHLGWATFLKGRDTGSGDPSPLYEQALQIDPHNVYANVMLGHWLMWQGKPYSAARPYFDTALAAGRAHALARGFQLAAIRNRNTDETDAELVRVVDEMRQQGETLDDRTARDAYSVYRRRYGPRVRVTPVGDIPLSAADQLATFTWLAKMPAVSASAEVDDAVVATLTGGGAPTTSPAAAGSRSPR